MPAEIDRVGSPGRYTSIMLPAIDSLFQQALELPDAERGELAARLLETLDPTGEDLTGEAWDVAWSQEIERRVREIRSKRVALADGADVLAEVRAIADQP
jgi:Putative addiction module component